jgi:hypothetical protein
MILCHIVGINNKLKESFIKELESISTNILIIDIDNISKKVIFEKEYTNIYNKYNQSTNKILLLSQLSQIWKNRLSIEIDKILLNNIKSQIILIGMTTFYMDLRIKLNLSEKIKNKFFINSNTDLHIKNLIENNLETYKNDIINGKFPLKYLDYNFLKSQREEIRDIYMMRDYKLKSYDDILQFIKNSIRLNDNGINNTVYFASFKRYEDKIDSIANTIVGYSDKWLSLISLFPKTKFKRGITFKDNKLRPYIQETGPLNINELNKCAYIYELVPSEKVDNHRFLIEDNKFIKRYYVSNIKSELDMYETIFDKYKTE